MSTHAKSQSRRRLPADAEKKGLALGTSTHERNPLTGSGSLPPAPEYDPSLTPASESHDLGKIAILPMTAAPVATSQVSQAHQAHQVQTQLRVSQPGDPHEQEADAVAEQVMRLPDTATATEGNAGKQPPAPTTAPEAAQAVPEGGGQPLDAATRAFMEPRFGHDFGQVRVHTDAQAAEAAEGLAARAYTVGRDIVFGAREYAPETTAGRHLLAHELTHVVQQAGDTTVARTVQREPAAATLPDSTTGFGKKISPDRMKDTELAEGIMHKLKGILGAWKTALSNFYVVLASSSDKETRPNFPDVILDFLREEAIGEIIKYVPLEMGRAYKLLTSLGTEDKKAQAAKDSAKLRDFVVSHASAIGDLETAAENNWSDFVAGVRLTAEAMNEDGNSSSAGKKSKGKGKDSVEVSSAATKVFDDYWMMHMALLDTYSALDAQVAFATSGNLFRVLSEEWIRGTMVKDGWDMKQASIVIRLSKDYSVKDAHIQGSGGQKIAEQLVKDAEKAHLEGVDLYNMRVRKEIQYYGNDDSYPTAYVHLRENNNIFDYVRGDAQAAAVWDYIKSNGARALITKKLDGD